MAGGEAHALHGCWHHAGELVDLTIECIAFIAVRVLCMLILCK